MMVAMRTDGDCTCAGVTSEPRGSSGDGGEISAKYEVQCDFRLHCSTVRVTVEQVALLPGCVDSTSSSLQLASSAHLPLLLRLVLRLVLGWYNRTRALLGDGLS